MINHSEIVILSLGSNVGDRRQYIDSALNLLVESNFISEPKISSYYETDPYGVKEQNSFLNIALMAKTELNPFMLLQICKTIEYSLGRKIRNRWHSREIDIDIIFYSDRIINFDTIEIPHKEIKNRNFVLIPINEIAPDFIHPIDQKSISQLLNECADDGKVVII
jgi:2-amino-4-hydroxy-6-hydroxymethyldihydropteridine diphosphokinase